MPVSASGTVSQEIVQTIDPTKVKLTGVADITYPAGWMLSYCSGAATDCTNAANFSATTPADATAWAAVKAVKATGSIVSEGASGSGKQVASRTSTGVLAPNGSSVSGPVAGDGWDVFFDPGYTRVFNRFHHDGNSKVDCNWLRTENGHTAGENCWSEVTEIRNGTAYWGKVTSSGVLDIPFAMSSNRSTGWIDSSNRLWVETAMRSPEWGFGFFCIDVSGASPQPCAGQSFYRLHAPTPAMASSDHDEVQDLAVVDGKIFTTTRNVGTAGTTHGKYVLCLDTRAAGGPAPCPGQPYALPSGPNETVTFATHDGAIAAIAGKVYAVGQSSAAPWHRLWCIDPTKIVAGATSSSIGCTGWAANPVDAVQGGPIITAPNSSGVPVAACTAFNFYGQATCINLANGTTTVPGLPSNLTAQLQSFYNGALGRGNVVSGVATSKTRVYWPYQSKVACFDAATNAMCSGGSWVTGQVSEQSVYAIRIDPMNPRCFWTNSDVGRIKVWTDTGVQGCSVPSPAVTFPAEVSVPRMACTANSGIQEWVDFRIAAAGSADRKWSSASLSVLDPSGTALSGWSEVVIPDSGVLSLAGLPVSGGSGGGSWVAGDLDFQVTFADPTYVTAPSATIKVIGDAPQLCLEVTALTACPVVSSGPVSAPVNTGTLTVLGDGSSTNASNVTTPMTQGTGTVSISAPTLVQCASTLSGRAGDASLGSGGSAVPGVTVTLLDSSGNPVLSGGSPVTATTDASGAYSFGYVAPGSYKVAFASTANVSLSATVTSGAAGSSLTTSSAVSGTSTSAVVAVAVGTAGVVNGLYALAAASAADTSTGGQGVTQTISPLSNDSASTNSSFSSSGTAVKLCQPGTSAPCALTSVTVNGEGTYTANANGTVTFVPLAGFTGVATPIPYTATDQAGSAASSTITATVVPVPVPVANTGSGDWDTNQVFTPFADDTPGSVGGTSYPFSASSVKICTTLTSDSSCTATSNIVVANEGTWSMNPATGVVTFDPLPSFTGPATPIKYCASDSVNQRVCSTITPTVNAPVAPSASAESKSVAPGGTVAFSTLTGAAGAGGASAGQSVGGLAARATATSPQFVNASTCLITPGSSPAACDADGVVTVAGEGTYTLNTTTGIVSFTAVANVAPGTLTPISYKVTDQVGNTATSTLTPVVPVPPTAVADTSSGGWDSNQTISVLGNDTVAATPATVKLCSTAELAVTPVSSITCTQTSLVVANEGTYTVNGDGSVGFDPLPTFTGTVASPPTYQVADAAGQKARALITPTVAAPPAPGANPDTQVVAPVSAGGTGSVNFDPLLGAGGLATGAGTPTVCLIDPVTSLCAGSNTVTIAGAGTYTLDPSTKVVSFTLDAGVTSAGSLAPVTYQVTDSFGQTATSTLTPVIPTPPTATADTSTGYQDVNQVIAVLGNDATSGSGNALVPASVKLCDPATTPPQTSPNCTATSVTIAGQGTYTVNANGSVTFDPDPSFTGTATAVSYQVADTAGLKASATITPTVLATPSGAGVVLPTASSDTKTGSYGQALTFGFSANTGLTGTNAGNDAAGAAPSSSTSGSVTTSYSTPVLDASSVRLCSSGQVLPGCSATSVTTIDGTYSVNGDGSVTFTPASGFTGTATQPVTYQVANSYTRTETTSTTTTTTTDPVSTCVSPSCSFAPATDANSVAPGGAGYIPTWSVTQTSSTQTPLSYAATALLTPTISAPSGPAASNDSATTTAGTPVSLSPHANDTAGSHQLRPGSVLLCGSGQTAPACTQTTVTIAGQGTFSVDTGTGVVTFTPEAGFTGTASVPYRILDWNGSATHATVTVTVTAPPGNSGGGTGGGSTTPDPDPDTDTDSVPGTDPTIGSTTSGTEPCTGTRCAPSTTPVPGDTSGPRLRPQRGSTVVNADQPVILDPWTRAAPTPGHRFVPASLRLWNGSTWVRQHTEPGVGTWSIKDGRITFVPAPGFTGEAVIRIRAQDTARATAMARMKVLVTPVDRPGRRPTGDVPASIDSGR